MLRQELDDKCDKLLKLRNDAQEKWGKAKINFMNIKDRSDDILKSIMDEIQLSYDEELPENKLTRLAKQTDKYKQHKTDLKIAQENELIKRIEFDRYRKEYEHYKTKYMKS